jgi:signal-transduction protein with cAMP-binding, CBS, and nucleotidyltransferase domain
MCPFGKHACNFSDDIKRLYIDYLRKERGLAENSILVYAPLINNFITEQEKQNGTNTQARLYQLYLKQVLSRKDYTEIEQVYGLMMQIRLIRQINAIIGEKVKPHNYVNPKTPSPMERKMLKEILKMIKVLQDRLSFEFTGAINT